MKYVGEQNLWFLVKTEMFLRTTFIRYTLDENFVKLKYETICTINTKRASTEKNGPYRTALPERVTT